MVRTLYSANLWNGEVEFGTYTVLKETEHSYTVETDSSWYKNGEQRVMKSSLAGYFFTQEEAVAYIEQREKESIERAQASIRASESKLAAISRWREKNNEDKP
jgi:hypothetical protein